MMANSSLFLLRKRSIREVQSVRKPRDVDSKTRVEAMVKTSHAYFETSQGDGLEGQVSIRAST